MIRTVCFDVGETLVDETRGWASWADWLGVPHFTFFGIFGSLIERGEHHRRVFEIVRPGIDLDREREKLRASGRGHDFDRDDFYPDALPCLAALRSAGIGIGIAGNQPEWVEPLLRALGLEVDFIATSEGWGVAKPEPEFFARVIEAAGVPAEEIAYVGDRLDNDVLPALAAGMLAVFLKRGPWGFVHATWPDAQRAHLRLDSLDELLPALQALSGNVAGP